MNEAGGIIVRKVISNTPGGFEELDRQRRMLGVEAWECLVGIETERLMLMDYLQGMGYSQVYIIPPRTTSSSRGRYGSSEAVSDRQDARLLADLLRTDRSRLRLWRPNSLLTQQLAASVSLEHFLCEEIVRITNRLRIVLWRYYPNASRIFSSLDTQIALQFICQFPTPDQAAELSLEEFKAFVRQHGYSHWSELPACYARLQAPQPKACPAVIQAFQGEAVRLAGLTLEMVRQRIRTQREIRVLFEQHPDHQIFASLPGLGDRLAPSLLVKFGDDRQRFPSPQSLQAVAGTCPYTRSSGKVKHILFRQSCDHELRQLAQIWARSSLRQSAWANTYFQSIQPHCHSFSHAYRCLANRWLEVAWRLWYDRVPYDEERHLRNHALRVKPK
jgi:transposase